MEVLELTRTHFKGPTAYIPCFAFLLCDFQSLLEFSHQKVLVPNLDLHIQVFLIIPHTYFFPLEMPFSFSANFVELSRLEDGARTRRSWLSLSLGQTPPGVGSGCISCGPPSLLPYQPQ